MNRRSAGSSARRSGRYGDEEARNLRCRLIDRAFQEEIEADRKLAIELLKDSDAGVRFQAASGLVRAGVKDSVPTLMRLMTDAPPPLAYQSEDLLYRWSLRWLEAERELSDQQADQVAAYQAHFERMRDLDRIIRRLHGSGQTTIEEASATEYYRVEAEIWLLKARDGKKNP